MAIRILTCNVRTSNANDGDNNWHNRKGICGEIISGLEPDLVGFQEMTTEQFDDLRNVLKGFGTLATLDKAGTGGPVNSIFYRQEKFNLVSNGAYWLSETPHVPGSRSWESDCIRLAVWGQFRSLDARGDLRFINTHLDHVSQKAREGQATKINEDSSAYETDFPQILTGDMNASSVNPAVASFFESGWSDTYETVHAVREPGYTFHRFEGEQFVGETVEKIDWILYRGNLRVIDAAIIRASKNGRYPSDHYFLSADFEFM